MQKNHNNATYFQSRNAYYQEEQKNAQSLFDNSIWLTTEEAASFMRKTAHAIRQLVYKSKISARKFNGRLYFKREDLNSLIDTSIY